MTRRWLWAAALALMAATNAGAVEPKAPEEHLQQGKLRKQFMSSDMSASKASPDLRRDVADELFDIERAARPNCEPELMSIRVISDPVLGRWMERWFVRSCFERIPYRVTYEPSKDPKKKSEIEFKVVPDMGRHGYPVR